MQYDAITIDTNIFRQNGYRLESGMLAQLNQFSGKVAGFVLSELVLRETERHMVENARAAHSRLVNAFQKSDDHHLFSSEKITSLRGNINDSKTPELAVAERLKTFLLNTGAEIVPSELANIKDLVKLYFQTDPPFESTGTKKHEFPDAIALLSLEEWAEENNCRILAVSDDKGWGDYAENSDWIDVETKLDKALEKFQQQAEEIINFFRSVLVNHDGSELTGLQDEIASSIKSSIAAAAFQPIAESASECEADDWSFECHSHEYLHDNDDIEFHIVSSEDGRIVVNVPVEIAIFGECSFSFYAYDSSDSDYVHLNTRTIEIDVNVEGTLLLTFLRNVDSEMGESELENVEITNLPPTIDFGYVDEFDPDEYYLE